VTTLSPERLQSEAYDVVVGRQAVVQALNTGPYDQGNEIQALPGFRASDIRYCLQSQPSSLGADLIAMGRGSWRHKLCGLFEQLGANPPASVEAHSRLYFATFHEVMKRAELFGLHMRTVTKWRMAGAILEEFATAYECDACLGASATAEGRSCPTCNGSGFRRSSVTWRSTECGCKVRDFRDRLDEFYAGVLASHIAAERSVLRGVMHCLRGTFGNARVADSIQRRPSHRAEVA
jgi:hypothetical protein